MPGETLPLVSRAFPSMGFLRDQMESKGLIAPVCQTGFNATMATLSHRRSVTVTEPADESTQGT